MKNKNELISLERASSFMNMTEDEVLKEIEEGNIRGIKLKSEYVIATEDIEEWYMRRSDYMDKEKALTILMECIDQNLSHPDFEPTKWLDQLKHTDRRKQLIKARQQIKQDFDI